MFQDEEGEDECEMTSDLKESEVRCSADARFVFSCFKILLCTVRFE